MIAARFCDCSSQSVGKPTEEVEVVEEMTTRRRGRRGAFGKLPKVEMDQDSLHDRRVFQEADDGQSALTLRAYERVRFVNLLNQPRPVAAALLAK